MGWKQRATLAFFGLPLQPIVHSDTWSWPHESRGLRVHQPWNIHWAEITVPWSSWLEGILDALEFEDSWWNAEQKGVRTTSVVKGCCVMKVGWEIHCRGPPTSATFSRGEDKATGHGAVNQHRLNTLWVTSEGRMVSQREVWRAVDHPTPANTVAKSRTGDRRG